MIYLRRSKRAIVITSIFLFLATLAFSLHFYSLKTDPQDNGMSAVLLIPFAFPWIYFIPSRWVNSSNWSALVYPITLIMILGNGLLLYLITGGLGIRRS